MPINVGIIYALLPASCYISLFEAYITTKLTPYVYFVISKWLNASTIAFSLSLGQCGTFALSDFA